MWHCVTYYVSLITFLTHECSIYFCSNYPAFHCRNQNLVKMSSCVCVCIQHSWLTAWDCFLFVTVYRSSNNDGVTGLAHSRCEQQKATIHASAALSYPHPECNNRVASFLRKLNMRTQTDRFRSTRILKAICQERFFRTSLPPMVAEG